MLISRRHARLNGDLQGLHGLGDKTVLLDDRLALWAMGELDQGAGPGVVLLGCAVEKQAARQGIVLGCDQAGAGRHRLGFTGGDGQGTSSADIGQADKADGLGITTDLVGQLFAGFKAQGAVCQLHGKSSQHQLLKGIEGAGIVVPGVQADAAGWPAELCPVVDLASKYGRQLIVAQGLQRIARVDDNGQTVEGDHLFGFGAAQIAQRGQFAGFAVLDWP